MYFVPSTGSTHQLMRYGCTVLRCGCAQLGTVRGTCHDVLCGLDACTDAQGASSLVGPQLTCLLDPVSSRPSCSTTVRGRVCITVHARPRPTDAGLSRPRRPSASLVAALASAEPFTLGRVAHQSQDKLMLHLHSASEPNNLSAGTNPGGDLLKVFRTANHPACVPRRSPAADFARPHRPRAKQNHASHDVTLPTFLSTTPPLASLTGSRGHLSSATGSAIVLPGETAWCATCTRQTAGDGLYICMYAAKVFRVCWAQRGHKGGQTRSSGPRSYLHAHVVGPDRHLLPSPPALNQGECA